ncbi:MAG: hypothetical protein SVY10_15395 [Thermodesulfobacteriota bacterium]|nr:hypothetical protein [Thermodesulfobacteriota bacterium]
MVESGADTKTQGKLKALISQMACLFGLKTQEMSHDEMRSQIQQTIDSLDRPSQPKSGVYHYVKDVFDDHFIYEAMSDDQEPNKLYKQVYEIVDDAVSMVGDPEEVRQETTYEPTTNQKKEPKINPGDGDTNPKGGDKMEITELINELIVNEATPWTEEDRPWLETASPETLTKMKPSELEKKPDGEQAKETTTINDAGDKEPEVTVESFIANAPKEIGEALTEAMAMRANEKAELIKGILANQRNEFTEDELKQMPQANLRKLGALNQVSGSNYTGQGGAPVTNQEEPLDLPTLPTLN